MIKNINKLSVTDADLLQSAEIHGTPCYIYDLKWILNQWKELKKILPDGSELCYSVKANPNCEIIKCLNKAGSFFDAASVNEIDLLISSEVAPDKIYYIAPGKSKRDIRSAIKNNIKAIVIDSPKELYKIIEVAEGMGKPQEVMFRLNPGEKSSGSLSMAGATQFGMSKEEIIVCWKELRNNPSIKCIGLHCYQGSNILEEILLIDEFDKVLNDFSDITGVLNEVPPLLDIGGGFGSPFSCEEHSLDLMKLKAGLTSVFSPHSRIFKNSQYIFESGRFIVGGGGIFLTSIRDVKESFNKKYVIIDGGIHCFGGLGRTNSFRPPPIRTLGTKETRIESVTLCGPSCTPLDVIAHNVKLPSPKEGDLIAIYNAGAYQQSASPGRFLSLGFPKEVCLFNKEATNLRLSNFEDSSCTIGIAGPKDTQRIVAFFKVYLHDNNPAIYSQEFLCNYGVSGAIRRQSVIVAHEKDSIVAACRYYRRKDGDISLYQFAIREDYRGRHLLFNMLKTLGNVCFHSKCPAEIEFNNYYKKTGWILDRTDKKYCHWILQINCNIEIG